MKTSSLLALSAVCALVSGPVRAAEGVFDSNGVPIRYVTEGQGEPVVLIHGWMADSSMWGADPSGNTRLTPAPGFQVIALDCRGHGRSGKPHEPGKYGAEMAADVVRLLDHLKIEKAHLVGYSMGAYVAAKVAATRPERVRSLVYGGQAPLLLGKTWTDSSEVTDFAKAAEEGKGMGAYILSIAPADKPKPTAEQADALAKWFYAGKDVKAFAAAGRGFKDLRVSADDLAKCPAPMLFIHGGNEPANLKDRVASLRKLLGRGDLKVVEGADHMTTLARPEFGTTIVDFLKNGKV